jgi:hypothetical protein
MWGSRNASEKQPPRTSMASMLHWSVVEVRGG